MINLLFSKPWAAVVEGAVRKYPNPLCTHVVALDLVNRNVDRKGILHSHRLMKIKWGVPEWVTAVSCFMPPSSIEF